MKKKIIAMILALGMIPLNVSAEEDTSHTMTFLDFDGNVMQTIEVNSGESIDYSQIDVSSLHTYPNLYTEQDFYAWSATPDTIDSDTTVQALYKRAIISTEGFPVKTEYYTTKGDVKFDGLSVIITIEIQTPVTNESGEFHVAVQKADVISNCRSDKTLEELFADGKTAEVNVIPTGDDKPIFTYEITLVDNLGDTDDNGLTDAVDATHILQLYASLSTGGNTSIDENQKTVCDINRDGLIDAQDATFILMYYAQSSTGGFPSWEEIVPSLV
ncbi:MAG: hypothetical protein K2L10_00785 [Ruminococcus sp.]|nr:hypothetical protein [Ruminococcus sp.]